MVVTIYTDGACEGNQFKTNIGGWAYLVLGLTPEEIIGTGAERNTTNNKMELTACISALTFLRSHFISPPKLPPIHLYADSEYVVKGVTEWRRGWEKKGWINSKGEPVKNKELWQQLFHLADELNILFIHVRGHAGNSYNERVDQLAVAAIHNFIPNRVFNKF